MNRIVPRGAVLGAALLAVGWLVAYSPNRVSATPVIPFGTVMASTQNGLVTEFDQTGVMLGQIYNGMGGATAGSVFDTSGNFYVSDFVNQRSTKFDPTGALITNTFGGGYNEDPESITLNAVGDVFVGQADGSHQILEFDSTGTPIAAFSPATEDRGTDWIDLAADQCTMFYTSEGVDILTFNICTLTQGPNFNLLPLPGQAYAHRIRPNGEILVADTTAVVRLDAAGNQIQTYTPGDGLLFALSLDPDGTSFWTAGLSSGAVFKIDIASGTILQQWSSAWVPGFVLLAGLSVKGEIVVSTQPTSTAATPTPTAQPTPTVSTQPTVTATPTSQPTPTAAPVLDHFTCYTTRSTAGSVPFQGIPDTPGLSLIDQFGPLTSGTKGPARLCAPTNKLGEDPAAPLHPEHLTSYPFTTAFRASPPLTEVKVVDQFNPTGIFFTVKLKKASHLLVPTVKNLSSTPPTPTQFVTDHFDCYRITRAKGTPKFRALKGVTLQDQFGPMTVAVKKPKYLCAPVNKNGEDPTAPTHPLHLLCYQVTQYDKVKFVKRIGLFVNNQFGPEQLDAKKPKELCVPSLKTLIPSPCTTIGAPCGSCGTGTCQSQCSGAGLICATNTCVNTCNNTGCPGGVCTEGTPANANCTLTQQGACPQPNNGYCEALCP